MHFADRQFNVALGQKILGIMEAREISTAQVCAVLFLASDTVRRKLRGQRAFSTIEILRIACLCGMSFNEILPDVRPFVRVGNDGNPNQFNGSRLSIGYDY